MEKLRSIAVLLTLNLLGVLSSFGQTCPQNIGFELGNLTNWQTFTGSVAAVNSENVITLINTGSPVFDRHMITSSKVVKDPYGNFPIVAPNNGNYSVKLGNSGTGRGAEGVSYVINVPQNKPNFVLTYQYAVVFQNPNHRAFEQPKFTAKILDVSTGTYVNCASFEYVATSNLPGFKTSSVNATVLYKDWTPVTINLNGYQGKQLILEFKTADCTLGGHFGYAYVDVNENCENLILGNEQCAGALESNLIGPSGYSAYKWFNEDRSVSYGEGQKIKITPALNFGDKVFLDLIPYEGFGCPNTVFTQIKQVTYELNLLSEADLCSNEVIDLTSSRFILNKSDDVSYTYFTDPELNFQLSDATDLGVGGTYYVKGTLPSGCSSVKSIKINVHDIPLDVVSNVNVCIGTIVDLTSNTIQRSVPSGTTVSYFRDATLKTVLVNPKNVPSGDYYIRYTSQYCTFVRKITVRISLFPILNVKESGSICEQNVFDLTSPTVTAGSDPALTYAYFTDAALTQPVADPKAIILAGDYYISATNAGGCTVSSKIHLEVFALPLLEVINPPTVCAPSTIDITNAALYEGTSEEVTFTYFDAEGVAITNPKEITQSGTYLVTVTNSNGCAVTKAIEVTINPQPILVINQPKKVFITQSVDLTNPEILKGSSGYSKIEYWEDMEMTTKLVNPKTVIKAGKYYISLTSASGCIVIAPVDVVTVDWPKIMVPTAFTPLKPTNNLLYPFVEGIQQLVSFKVYNKWGNLVFETTSMDPKDGWNGTYRNALQPFETYSWFAEAINLLDYTFTTKGKTVLIP